jgi:hypothetical protein
MRVCLVIGALAAGASVSWADLDGTELNQFTIHTGPFGEVVGGLYTYGTTETFFDTFGFSYDVISAAGIPGFDNSIEYDFANFAYTDFAGETGTIMIDQIVEDVEKNSLVIIGNDMTTEIGFNYSAGPGGELSGDWLVDDALALGVGSDTSVFVCWNSVGGDECFADCDGNGELNILDFVCYQGLFQSGDPGADCDGNGELNILDFVCFQTAFQAGCP